MGGDGLSSIKADFRVKAVDNWWKVAQYVGEIVGGQGWVDFKLVFGKIGQF